jgi:arginine-tRNA-protein transferase
MFIVLRTTEGPEQCQYLPDRLSTLDVQLVGRISPAEYEARMNEGWRKFGRILFRPRCAGCTECRPMRLPVELFRPDRSQRRAIQRNADLNVRIERPAMDSSRLELWNRYHAWQSERKGWPESSADPWHYSFTYVKNPIPSLEVAAYEGDRLLGVALLDVTPNSLSGIYHYYDPECTDRSLGKFLMLRSIQAAKELGKKYFYLGYYVAGCGSMEYKAGFRPCEILSIEGKWQSHVDISPDGV